MRHIGLRRWVNVVDGAGEKFTNVYPCMFIEREGDLLALVGWEIAGSSYGHVRHI